MFALEFDRLSKRYASVWANREITLHITSGSIVGLLGPNGAGKTTLLRQLVGLTRPTTGTIAIDQQRVVPGMRWVKETIAYLPQHPLALADLTVYEAICFSARLRGQSPKDAENHTRELLERLDLTGLSQRQVVSLSGGERRLVGVASVVVAPTPIIALDEPTNELDPLMRHRIWDLIQNLRHPDRILLLVSHNVLEAERVLDRVLIMHQGQIIRDGSPGSLRQNAGDFLNVVVTVSDDPKRLDPDLTGFSPGLHVHGRVVEFTAPRVQALGYLAKWLAEPGLVDSVAVNEPTLEDAYLAIRQQSAPDRPQGGSK